MPNKQDTGDGLQPRLIRSVPVNSEQEALDKPIGDLPVGTEKDRDLEVDDDYNPVHTKTEPRRIK